jgi:hypothetical protein
MRVKISSSIEMLEALEAALPEVEDLGRCGEMRDIHDR